MDLCGSIKRQLQSANTHSHDDNRFLALLFHHNLPVRTTFPRMLRRNTRPRVEPLQIRRCRVGLS